MNGEIIYILYLYLSYALLFYLHRFGLQALLPMDNHTSSRRARVKLVQEQEVAEDWRRSRNKRQISTCCCSERLQNKGARKRRERGRARHAVQTASERQATSQWKSTRETPNTWLTGSTELPRFQVAGKLASYASLQCNIQLHSQSAFSAEGSGNQTKVWSP